MYFKNKCKKIWKYGNIFGSLLYKQKQISYEQRKRVTIRTTY
jgi:hypothetical protein